MNFRDTNLYSPAGKHKLVPIRISEFRHGSPGLLLRFRSKFHAFGLEKSRRCKHVVAPECDRLKTANAALVSRRRKQRKIHIRAWNQQFDPSLLCSEGLVRCHFKANL